MSKKEIALLPGDGIGPEVIAEARRVLEWFVARRKLDVVLDEHPYGAGAYRRLGQVLPKATEDAIRAGTGSSTGRRTLGHRQRGTRFAILEVQARAWYRAGS